MANEITYQTGLSVKKGNLNVAKANGSLRANMAGTHTAGGSMDVPTTSAGTAIPIGSVATCGIAFVQNVDATNYIELGVQVAGTFYPFVKLKPGEAFPFRLAINAPYARSHTLACVLDYLIIED